MSGDRIVPEATRLPQILAEQESAVLDRWLQEQQAAGAFRTGMIDEREVRDRT